LPPGARAIGQTIRDLGFEGGRVTVSAIRRAGVTGRDPDPDTRLRIGDVLVLWGLPEDLQLAERRLLMG
jgi:CPA2 family monovalent cation:H+ antiporter-2